MLDWVGIGTIGWSAPDVLTAGFGISGQVGARSSAFLGAAETELRSSRYLIRSDEGRVYQNSQVLCEAHDPAARIKRAKSPMPLDCSDRRNPVPSDSCKRESNPASSTRCCSHRMTSPAATTCRR